MFASVLRTPGVRAIYLTSILGRLPAGAMGLVLILRTREMTGSYAAGGAAAAGFAIAMGLASPLLGRLIDRRGQTGVLVASALWSSIAVAAFAALPDGAPAVAAVALSALAGAGTPPLSACQRALWNEAIEPRLRHSAYALDSVVFELVYISGPLLLVGVVGGWSLRAAALAGALLGGIGTIAFAATRLSRTWRPHTARAADRWGPLRGAGVRTVLAALGLLAIGLAAAEIGMAAFAEREGSPRAVGILLALWGAGSLAGGLIFGRRPPAADPARRLAMLLLGLAVLEVPLLLVGDLVTMGAAITLAGVGIAPGMAAAFHLLSEVAPPGTVTEAQTWVATGFGGGMAAGSALGGWLVEHVGTGAAFGVVVATGLAATGVVATRLGTLRTAAPAEAQELVAA